MDLPPMTKCKVDKRGRHHLSYVIPSDDDRDLTMVCDHCGSMRRVPVSGGLLTPRLDDETAEVIAFAARIARE